MICQVIQKYSEEVRDYTFDFSQYPEIASNGEQISMVTFSADPASDNLTLTDGTHTASTASVLVSNGTGGTSYKIECVAVTNESHTIAAVMTVDVLPW